MKNLFTFSLLLMAIFIPLSSHGQSWKYLNKDNSNLPVNSIQDIYFDTDQSVWFCTQDSGLIHYRNGIVNVYNSTTGNGFDADYVSRIIKDPNGSYWIATEYHGLYKYADGQFVQYADDGAGHTITYARSLTLQNGGPDNGGSIWVGTWGQGLFRFDGTNWSYFDQSSGILPDNSVLALAAEDDPNSNKSVLWAGTNSGLMKYDGTAWEAFDVGDLNNPWINAVSLKDGGFTFGNGQLIIGCEGGELAIYDGSNWTIFNMADAWNPNNSVTSLAVDPAGVVWFGQDEEGLGRYDEKSLLSYYKDNSGITGNNVITVAVRIAGDSTEVWSSVYDNGYRGINIYTEESPTALTEQRHLPATFSLYQNYPNPFNPSTHIRFSLVKSNATRLTVFNALGQKVRTLVNRRMAAGNFDIIFDARDLPSGVYFYTLQSGNLRITRKMLLLQ